MTAADILCALLLTLICVLYGVIDYYYGSD